MSGSPTRPGSARRAARRCARGRSRRSRPRRRRTAAGRGAAPGGGARPRPAASAYGSPSSPSDPAHDLARAVADERVAADALALLGGLEQERGPGAAQLEERGDRRLAVVDERVAHRDEVVVPPASARTSSRRRLDAAAAARTQRRRARSTSSASARSRPRAVQQHGEVVEHVGGLLGDALVGLLARRARDLLGLLLHLLADQRGVVEQRRPCRSPRAARRRGRRACARGRAAPRAARAARARRGGSRSARRCGTPGRPARRARAAASPSQSKRMRAHRLGVARRRALVPQLLRASGSTGAARRSRACARSASAFM